MNVKSRHRNMNGNHLNRSVTLRNSRRKKTCCLRSKNCYSCCHLNSRMNGWKMTKALWNCCSCRRSCFWSLMKNSLRPKHFWWMKRNFWTWMNSWKEKNCGTQKNSLRWKWTWYRIQTWCWKRTNVPSILRCGAPVLLCCGNCRCCGVRRRCRLRRYSSLPACWGPSGGIGRGRRNNSRSGGGNSTNNNLRSSTACAS